MKVIIYRDKETKKIVRDAGDDYELLKARGKTDEDIAALVEEFNGRENCPQTVEIVELDEVAEYYRTRKLNAYKEQLNDFAFMEDRLDELSRMIENYIDACKKAEPAASQSEDGAPLRELETYKQEYRLAAAANKQLADALDKAREENKMLRLQIFAFVRNSAVLPVGRRLNKSEQEITDKTFETIAAAKAMLDVEAVKAAMNLATNKGNRFDNAD